MDSSPRFVFLVNAAAGTGQAPRKLAALIAEQPHVAARARVVATRSAAELEQALRLADDEIPVAVGGDGSFNALVSLLDRRGEISRMMGLIPFGTGNATAHTLGLRSARVAMAALVRNKTASLDIMRTSIPQAPIALVSCSTGFESNFLQRYSALRYRSRQWAGWSALALNISKRFSGATLSVDGRAWLGDSELVYNVGVYNIPHYAFGRVMWRGMRADDGLAVAAAVSSPAAYWNLMLRGVPAADSPTAPTTPLPGVRIARWRSAEIFSPVPLQVDGEFVGVHHAELTVDSCALTAICAT